MVKTILTSSSYVNLVLILTPSRIETFWRSVAWVAVLLIKRCTVFLTNAKYCHRLSTFLSVCLLLLYEYVSRSTKTHHIYAYTQISVRVYFQVPFFLFNKFFFSYFMLHFS